MRWRPVLLGGGALVGFEPFLPVDPWSSPAGIFGAWSVNAVSPDIPDFLRADTDGFTLPLREMAVYAGTVAPFEHAAEQAAPRLAGVTVSASKARAICLEARDMAESLLATGQLATIAAFEPGKRLYVSHGGGMASLT